MLRAYDIKYMPRIAIKGQVLADFVVEFTDGTMIEEDKALGVMVTSAIVVLPWEVYTNGAANRKRAGLGVVVITLEKLVMEKSLRLGFLATNNEAEYEALLAGIAMVKQLGRDVVELYSDSRLVISLVSGEFEALNERMQGYLFKVRCAWA